MGHLSVIRRRHDSEHAKRVSSFQIFGLMSRLQAGYFDGALGCGLARASSDRHSCILYKSDGKWVVRLIGRDKDS
jgi:hypothetical protein